MMSILTHLSGKVVDDGVTSSEREVAILAGASLVKYIWLDRGCALTLCHTS